MYKKETYLYIKAALDAANIENAAFDAKILAEYAQESGIEPDYLTAQRIKRVPLQYIVGRWEFFGDTYITSPNTLIPRPETEFIVEYAIQSAPASKILLDLCTGSGCIAISTLKKRTDICAVCADISSEALFVAAQNAEINGVSDRITFALCDVGDKNASSKLIDSCGKIGLITSNPPYLTTSETEAEVLRSEELSHEPRIAFDGGGDGLMFYRAIIANFTQTTGATTVFEAGINQAAAIKAMFSAIGFDTSSVYDYSKIERVIIGMPI